MEGGTAGSRHHATWRENRSLRQIFKPGEFGKILKAERGQSNLISTIVPAS
jgi:hypothetical protein